jgi:hypothetical protein
LQLLQPVWGQVAPTGGYEEQMRRAEKEGNKVYDWIRKQAPVAPRVAATAKPIPKPVPKPLQVPAPEPVLEPVPAPEPAPASNSVSPASAEVAPDQENKSQLPATGATVEIIEASTTAEVPVPQSANENK